MIRLPAPLAALLVSAAVLAAPVEVGFVEEFALAPDRTVPLKELIPGTQEYYYYHCLHYQNTGALDQAEDMLQRWIKKHGHNGQVEEMLNRQALLRYPADPKQALARIRQRLGLTFKHVRRERERETTYPTRLDPRLISREVLDKRAFSYNRLLGGFTAAAYRRLAGMELSWERRRTLLKSMDFADVPNLVDLVVADLRQKGSEGFGSPNAHRSMTLAQLDACAQRIPALLGNQNFVNAYLLRLVPESDEDMDTAAVRLAYLERLQSFAARLTPAWNVLKANVLYRRLEFGRTQDVHDQARFLAYLKLPRNAGYVRREYLRRQEFRGVTVNLGARVGNYPLLKVGIRNDEPLVRAYLHRFLADAQGYAPFAPYLEETYLKEVFAEANILAGAGDQERWHAMIAPGRLRALKERVDIELLPTCKKRFGVEEPVKLVVGVKNVQSLLVRVYEINTFNYYRAKGKEVGTSVDLDGLVANREQAFAYTQPALRRHEETFTFPGLNRPGVWVIELIGNGRSSRSVIRKGQLRFTQRLGSAGHVFRVYDQDNALVKDAALWLGNQEYRPDEAGEIAVPFSTKAGETIDIFADTPEPGQAFVLRRGDFAALGRFAQQSENYSLGAGFQLGREALVQGEMAKLLVRPHLSVQGVPVDVGLLEDVSLTLTSTDIHDTATTKVYRNLKLLNDEVTVCEFRVPADMQRLQYQLTAKIRNLSRGKEEILVAEGNCQANGVDAQLRVASLHLRPAADGYALELLGKTGEVLPERTVALALFHKEYRIQTTVRLQTDKAGQVQLGALAGVRSLTAEAADYALSVELGELRAGAMRFPRALNGVVGDIFEVPLPGGTASQVSLLEMVPNWNSPALSPAIPKAQTVLSDRRDHVAVADGAVRVSDLPAGDYWLVLRDASGVRLATITISVVPGARKRGWAMGPERVLGARNSRLLGIRSATVSDVEGKQQLKVQLANPTADTRVHVLAGRYAVDDPLRLGPGTGAGQGSLRFTQPVCYYVSGRSLGDELRYVLERRNAVKRPGNLLTKPSLLLNPWALGETQSNSEQLRQGGAYREVGADGKAGGEMGGMGGGPGGMGGFGVMTGPANYDFLMTSALVVENLKPDADGVVTLDLELGTRQYLQVIATNGRDLVRQPVLRSFTGETYRDLRLRRQMAADRHFTEQKRVDIVATGTPFTVPDMRSSKVRVYATLTDAYGLFRTLGGDEPLTKFEFVCRWPKLSDEEKRTLYGKYACHELSFFVYRKDRAFFDQIVKPYLASKKDKTFLDHWLLGNDLASYLEPWAYGRLNIVERILLAQRLPAQGQATRRHVQDLFDLLTPSADAFNWFFDAAVKSAALDEASGMELPESAQSLIETSAEAAPASGKRPGKPSNRSKKVSRSPVGKMSGSVKSKRLAAEKKSPAPPREAQQDDLEDALSGITRLSAAQIRDRERRSDVRQLFRKLEVTKEWAENNYYHVPIARQTAGLIRVNGFWRDYAAHDGDTPFLSTRFPEVITSHTGMLMALAVLDLPFEGEAPEPVFDGPSMTFTPKHSVIVFHQQIREADPAAEAVPLLLGQNFFAADDRYRREGNLKFDKFVTEEFQSGRIYGCQVVVTNPTSARRELDVLLRIPLGAMPVNKGFRTRGVHLAIAGYRTKTVDYYFYFPKPGDFPLYPVHAAQNGKLLAFAKPFQFHVVETLTKIDTTSWDHISQYGSEGEVIAFLRANNIDRLDLGLIAFRMKDKAFFAQVIPLLRARHVFNSVLWSYGAMHDDPAVIREFLPHTPFADQCGMVFESSLLAVDPVARVHYQHKEYWPLINARAHRVGGRPRILNRQFHGQYTSYLTTLAYRPMLDHGENLTLAMYLLLQDRVDEALTAFAKIDPAQLTERIQYDYLKAYLAFSQSDPKAARRIARGYREYPVPRWQKLFAEILAQCDEIDGDATAVIDKDNRTQTQTALAAPQPSFEFVIEDAEIRLDYQNLASVQVNFYRMDLELLFSRTPFLMDVSDQFSVIKPNATQVVKLAKGKMARTIAIPKEFAKLNTMVEVVGVGQRKAKPYYPNRMTVQMIEAYGQIKVTQAGTRKALAAVYVKVYARQSSGKVVFFKDGYTDLRGRFDYASVSTGDVGQVERFAILVLSDKAGAVVREAKPPVR